MQNDVSQMSDKSGAVGNGDDEGGAITFILQIRVARKKEVASERNNVASYARGRTTGKIL